MRKLATCVLGLALPWALIPSLALAGDWMITAKGGATIPTGNFGDEKVLGAKVGYQVGGGLEYKMNSMWALGVDGSWNKNKGSLEGQTIVTETVEKAEFTTTQFGGHLKYLIPVEGALRPFALLGLGAYQVKYKESGTDSISGPYSFEIDGGTHFGGRLGVGAAYWLSDMWAVGAGASYNLIVTDKKKGFEQSSLQYVGLTGQLTLKIPSGAKE